MRSEVNVATSSKKKHADDESMQFDGNEEADQLQPSMLADALEIREDANLTAVRRPLWTSQYPWGAPLDTLHVMLSND